MVRSNNTPIWGSLEFFKELRNQTTWLRMKWDLFLQLYATSHERIELLNRAASGFFASLQYIMQDDLVLGIARLLDPPRSRGRDNVSLSQLVNLIINEKLAAETSRKLDELRSVATPLMQRRNRRIAHLDLRTFQNADYLPPAQRLEIEESIRRIEEIMSLIERHYLGSVTERPRVHGDANTLAYFLNRGLEEE